MRFRAGLTLFLAALMLAAYVPSHAFAQGDIAVGRIWAYPAQGPAEQKGFDMRGEPRGNTVDLFATLFNGTGSASRITGVTTPIASKTAIVRWFKGNQMVDRFPLELPRGKPVDLGPQTEFIRLFGVSGAPHPGDRFPVTFHFAGVPDVTVDVLVQPR